MKRFFALALALAVVAPVGLSGCGETEKSQVKETTSGPGGSATTTTTKETTVKGDGGAAPAGSGTGATTK